MNQKELKLFWHFAKSRGIDLLIEPEGIETFQKRVCDAFLRLLIEPEGIETSVTVNILYGIRLLIEPEGIETFIVSLKIVSPFSINWTRRNWNLIAGIAALLATIY